MHVAVEATHSPLSSRGPLDDEPSEDSAGPATRGRRSFAIVSPSRLPRQLPLLPAPTSARSRTPARSRSAPPAAERTRRSLPSRPAPEVPTARSEDLIAAVKAAIEARGEELVGPTDDDPQDPARPSPVWISPTKAALRYGEICLARTASDPKGPKALVRISSYRVPAPVPADKRPYRRWHGIDILAFLTSGVRREVRIAQVLKGSRF